MGSRSALLAAAVLLGQFSIGWANDAVDAPLDIRVGRRSKPIAAGEVSRHTVSRCATAALVVDVPLSLAVGWRSGAAHLVAVGGAWLYDLGLKRTLASVVPYAVSFGLVPVFVAAALPGAPLPRGALVAAAAACGVAAHFANTVGDAADDAVTGVHGLPQRIGPSRSTVVAAIAVAVAGVLILVAVGVTPLTLGAVVVDVAGVAAIPILRRRPAARQTPFRVVLLAVGVLVIAFVVSGGSHLTAT